MTRRITVGSGVMALAAAFLVLRAPLASGSLEELGEGPGFAVVELFTSQGCSSCPPADRVLARLADVAEKEGLAVYPLSMHVDYWNRLGWRDPFSDRKYSARQQAYAHALGKGAFTPQVIVNGADETVGSREAELADLITRQLAAKPTAKVSVKVDRDGDRVRVRPTVESAPDGAIHWVALSRRTGGNHVPAGENEGRELHHAHVVFALEQVPNGQEVQFDLSPQVTAEPIAVTAFVQDPKSMRILGAAREPAPASTP